MKSVFVFLFGWGFGWFTTTHPGFVTTWLRHLGL